MEENQNRRKTPVDDINSTIKNTIGLIQRARQLGQVANFIQGMITTLANAAPSTTIFGVIFGIVLVVVLLGSIFITFMGAPPVAVGGTGGSGTGSPPPPPSGTSGNAAIVSWAEQISSVLDHYPSMCNGSFYMYNRKLTKVSNAGYNSRTGPGTVCGLGWGTYFCSFFVADAFRLAGYPAPTYSFVADMVANWDKPGFSLVKQNNMRGISPGDAIFWSTDQTPPSISPNYFKHTSLVYTVNINQDTGNGSVTVIEANTDAKTHKFNVVNWAIQGNWSSGANHPWFGLVR